ncbi:MAG: hypothetical protein AAFR61_23750 [Bacteroidota bacterium]
MQKFTVSLLLTALVLIPGWLKAQDEASLIRESAEKIAQATLDLDFSQIVTFTYPGLVELMGGKDQMITLMESSLGGMKEQGFVIESVEIGQPSKRVKAGEEIHCLVPQKLAMTFSGGTIITESDMIGISQDQGKSWTFLGTSNMTTEQLLAILPEYNVDELGLPQSKEPQVIEKE